MSYTFSFGDTGIILNTDPDTPTSPFVDVVRVSGLDNAEYRITERQREGMDGGFADAEFEQMRTIILEGEVYNATEDYMERLKANYAPARDPQPFYFDALGVSQRLVFCKSYGARYSWDTQRRLGIVPIMFQLKAEDPTIYDAVPIVVTTDLYTEVVPGFGFDLDFDFDFGGPGSVAGTATINNLGNKPTDCTFTIQGPIIGPAIVHDQSGNRLTFDIELLEGDSLVVNLRNKTVLLGGTSNRRAILTGTSRWFMLEPGMNTIRFLGEAGAGSPLLICSTRSAYR